MEQTSSKQRTPNWFTAKELDEDTGLYYFGARYYDPRTSVWISADPALGKFLPTGDEERDSNLPGLGGVYNSLNLGVYTYTQLNPVRLVDPDGRFTFQIGLTGTAGAGGGATLTKGRTFGITSKGIQFGKFRTVGGGGFGGISATGTIDLTFSGARDISELEGTALTVGGALSPFPGLSTVVGGEVNIPEKQGAPKSFTVFGGIEVASLTPGEVFGFVTDTKVEETFSLNFKDIASSIKSFLTPSMSKPPAPSGAESGNVTSEDFGVQL